VNNIVLSGGEGHLIDFDHCKITNCLTDHFIRLIGQTPDVELHPRLRSKWLQSIEERVLKIIAAIHGPGQDAGAQLSALELYIYPEVFEQSTLVSVIDLGWDQVRETLLRSLPILMYI
jgi:hypothetical protein